MIDDHPPLLGWSSKNLYLGILFFVLTAGIPALIHTQFVTGPLVNGLLILAVLTLGTSTALILSFIPSMVALIKGLLPAVLSPTVPFIMVSNVVLVVVFSKLINLKNPNPKNFVLSLVAAAFAKFAFLFIASQYFLPNLLVTPVVIERANELLGPNQFLTALIGGGVAYFCYRLLKKGALNF